MTARRLLTLATLLLGASVPARGQGGGATQTCPDDTDTPDILGYYVEVAYRALERDPSGPLPPPCLMAAITITRARSVPTSDRGRWQSLEIQRSFPDLTVAHALALTEASLVRTPTDVSLLETKVRLLARRRRFADVSPTFDLLLARDSTRGTLELYKLAISSGRRAADTAAMLRYLTAANTKFPTVSQLAMELTVLRQVPRLRSLIDSVHRAMKADPSLTLGYVTLVSIFGNLDEPDSTLTYLRRGLARGVPRQTMTMSLRSLIGALLREAQISDAVDTWEKTVPIAFDIDSAMSTPETKYLVALSISRMVAGRIDLANFYLPAMEIGHGYPPIESIDLTRTPTGSSDQGCSSIASVIRLIARADERMTSGGNRFAPETAPAIVAALHTMRDQLAPFTKRCGSP